MVVPVSLSDAAYRRIRVFILEGTFAESSLHSIYGLASTLGISRTPVREAVLRLVDDGLVTVEPNRGFRVRGISAAEIREVFEARLLLEVPAASYAARHAGSGQREKLLAILGSMRDAADVGDETRFAELDRDLHRCIAAVLSNERLLDQIDKLRAFIQLHRLSTVRSSRGLTEIWDEHAQIVRAIADSDAVMAAQHMEMHLTVTCRLLVPGRSGLTEP